MTFNCLAVLCNRWSSFFSIASIKVADPSSCSTLLNVSQCLDLLFLFVFLVESKSLLFFHISFDLRPLLYLKVLLAVARLWFLLNFLLFFCFFFVLMFCLILCHLWSHSCIGGDIWQFHFLTIQLHLYCICQEWDGNFKKLGRSS